MTRECEVEVQWTRVSRPVTEWRICSYKIGAQCRFIMQMRVHSEKKSRGKNGNT